MPERSEICSQLLHIWSRELCSSGRHDNSCRVGPNTRSHAHVRHTSSGFSILRPFAHRIGVRCGECRRERGVSGWCAALLAAAGTEAHVLLLPLRDGAESLRRLVRPITPSPSPSILLGPSPIVEAGSGTQALEVFGKHQPDLVVLDLRLPYAL